jgi:hypothetical protein
VHDWFSVEDWATQKLGIFGATSSGIVSLEQRKHLGHALDRAREFKSYFVSTDSLSYLPIGVLASEVHPTPWTVIRDGPAAIKGWDFVTAPRRNGDERVDFGGAMPPAGVPYQLFRTSNAHEHLLNDIGQVESILLQLSR